MRRGRASAWRRVVTLLLACVVAGCGGSSSEGGQATADGALHSLLIHFGVDAIPAAPYIDADAGEVYFSFEGDMYASGVDPQTGLVGDHSAEPIGRFGPALVAFRVNPAQPITSSEFLTFRCVRCTIEFNGGPNADARFKPLLPADDGDPVAEDERDRTLAFEVPMQGHFLQNLGVLNPQAPLTLGVGLRGMGCGGTQEVRGKGLLAGGRGTICMNGQFEFTTPQIGKLVEALAPFATGSAGPEATTALLTTLASSIFRGRSDCSITMHRPLRGDGT